jgi:hypothetical protein
MNKNIGHRKLEEGHRVRYNLTEKDSELMGIMFSPYLQKESDSREENKKLLSEASPEKKAMLRKMGGRKVYMVETASGDEEGGIRSIYITDVKNKEEARKVAARIVPREAVFRDVSIIKFGTLDPSEMMMFGRKNYAKFDLEWGD